MAREVHRLKPQGPRSPVRPDGAGLDRALEALERALASHLAGDWSHADPDGRFQALVESSLQGILVHRDWVPLFANTAYAHMLGYAGAGELLEQDSIERHVPGYDRERRRRYMQRRLRGEDAPARYAVDALRVDGQLICLDIIANAVNWEGEPAILIVALDVTEQRETEAALRWSEQRFRDISEAAGDWFWELDEALRLVHISARFEACSGTSPQRIVGRALEEVAPVELAPQSWQRHLERLRAHEPFRNFDFPLRHWDGHTAVIRINGIPFFGDDGRFLGYRGTGEDVTEQLETERRLRETERLLIEALGNISDGVALFDADDRLVVCNDTWRAQLSAPLASLVKPGVEFEQLARAVAREVRREPSQDADAWVEERMRKHRECGPPFEMERQCGHWRLVSETRVPSGGVMIVTSDITSLKHREQALEASEARFRDFAETAADFFWEIDGELRYTFVSDRFENVTGFRRDAVIGQTRENVLLTIGVDPEHVARHVDDLRAKREFEGFEFEWHDTEDNHRVLSLSGKPIHAPDGTFAGFRGTGRDISSRHRLAREMAHQASHDSLTGLVNRRAFEERLGRVLETAREEPSEHALCYLDLDQFKIINDTCGHIAGDSLLRALSAELLRRVRRRDTLARLGGDEFGLLMEHCSLDHARRVARSLLETVEEFRFGWEGRSFRLGVSIGLVPINGDERDTSDILRAADSACYAAKDQGRNRIHLYRPDDAELARRQGEMQWVSRLNDALAENRFQLCYQPVVPVAEGPVPGDTGLSFELVLRMLDGAGRVILPHAFLPAAERYGIAVRIDRWVINSCAAWLASDRCPRDRISMMMINLSGRSLGDESVLELIKKHLRDGTLPARRLCFEITETAAIADIGLAREFLENLRAEGCHFALDDFGSGLSSFAYLRSLPVDFLKIDGTFVRDMARDPIDFAMVRSISEVGRVMGKRIIAESVEDVEVWKKVREIGIDYAQGYFVGAPRPLDQFERDPDSA